MPKVYGYLRVSHQDSLDSGLGLKAQRRQIVRWFKLLRAGDRQLEWGGVLTDKAVSAYKKIMISRPAGKALHKRLQPGDHVVFARLDRGFRNTVDCLQMITLWKNRGITTHFVNLQLNTASATGKLMLTMIAAMAEWESSMKSERTREALAVKKLNRERVGGRHNPLGWKVGGRKKNGAKVLVVDREKLALCRLSWLLRKRHGLSFMLICDRIEAMLAKRSGRKIVPRCNPREWGYHAVRTGIIRWDKYLEDKAIDPDTPWPNTNDGMHVATILKARSAHPRSGTH